MDEEEYQKMIKRCLRCSICKWIPQIQIKSQKYASIRILAVFIAISGKADFTPAPAPQQ
ncbi:unnamed protein product [marine sediment metagenome]|uniref:Uncharacterized protein n=1 Tax=marine sediment metagenome TaxID=412755 RepID=X1K0Q4_9ZZZZ